ncbi:SDR family NAD(P)-dependent oxidoreductase [Microbacterium sp. Mu-80]|uniref:SDR family NAD(P)-dependent oxidoreductase n=1 Tax=Microbacterium bandirmense TaxID=3122050 RepID=A0ABU8LA91_9MICO
MNASYGSETETALADIVRVSRAMGADPSLVLHGGGNTSIKTTGLDVTGDDVELIFVKGSGWNLATIEAAGFAPLRRERLGELLQLEKLDDPTMVNELRQASLDAAAPTASIEALLHGYLPGRVVLHSHADAIVALTNRDVAPAAIADVLGERVLVLPYVLPGFALARLVAQTDVSGVDAIVLSNHGLFTFGEDPDETLARHLDLVGRATEALGARSWGADGGEATRDGDLLTLAALRADVSRVAGRPLIVQQSGSGKAAAYARRNDIAEASSRGTATPEHVLYTKRAPLVGRDVAAYAAEYEAYFARNRDRATTPVTALDPAPRIILDPELGMLVAGDTADAINVAHDIALHTIDVVERADALGGYMSLDEPSTFDIEYWSLEQAKLAKRTRLPLGGEVALVIGAGSERGSALVQGLLAAGAAVVGVDDDSAVSTAGKSIGWRFVAGDVSDTQVLARAVETAVRDFGGIDMLALLADSDTSRSSHASEIDDAAWQRAWEINTMSVARALRVSRPLLERAPRGGRVVHQGAYGGAASPERAAAVAAASVIVDATWKEWGPGIRVSEVPAGYSLLDKLMA